MTVNVDTAAAPALGILAVYAKQRCACVSHWKAVAAAAEAEGATPGAVLAAVARRRNHYSELRRRGVPHEPALVAVGITWPVREAEAAAWPLKRRRQLARLANRRKAARRERWLEACRAARESGLAHDSAAAQLAQVFDTSPELAHKRLRWARERYERAEVPVPRRELAPQ